MTAKRTIPYSKKALYDTGAVRTFTGRQLDEIAFPLGGIGTGSISLGGWGQLRDWEIFNRPNKGYAPRASFFALHAKEAGGERMTRVLRGRQGGSYVGGGHGDFDMAAGFPAMRACKFTGLFPLARIDLSDPAFPLKVRLEAFNPFIPLDEKASSIPVAILLFSLRNGGRRKVTARLFGALENIAGHPEREGGRNETKRGRLVRGILMSNPNHKPGTARHGTLVLASPHARVRATADSVPEHTHSAAAWSLWRALREGGTAPNQVGTATGAGKHNPIAGLTLDTEVSPGATVRLPVLIAWHSPVSDVGVSAEQAKKGRGWRTYSATLFKDAWDVADYTAAHLERLESQTRLFAKRLYGSSLPGVAKEAVGSQISILKSTTCLRFEDGGFWGWEGVSDKGGCCAGTCTHVWNYAQALPYLFPALARSIHDQQFGLNMAEDGRMCFRQPLPPGTKANVPHMHAAADGQLGGVLRVYREWRISGNDAWLRATWPKCKKSLEYAWLYWDPDRDGVMEGVQHNTFDNEFWGPNTMLGAIYLGALRAAEEMARYLGAEESAAEYRRVFESGSKKMDKMLFNGKWYRQIINPKANALTDHKSDHLVKGEKVPRWQYGNGCLSDQLLGQWYAAMLGLGYLFERGNVRKALRSVFKRNWRADLSEHAALLRNYAFAGEAGLIVCTWPEGGQPPYPFWFASEVWCGCEYQVASHLIYEGFVDEGLAIVKGVRDRHDGTRRNPWNEFECGHHYSRSMASYALLLALSGFQYQAHKQRLGFAPRVNERDFRCFFSAQAAWGEYRQRVHRARAEIVIQVDVGALPLRELRLAGAAARMGGSVSAKIGQRRVACRKSGGAKRAALAFQPAVTVTPDSALSLTLR